ncbi:MAG: hypothetical protein ACJ72Y_05585 [Actinomycetes bacterium]
MSPNLEAISPRTVVLHWIPLGAGSSVPTVRWSGRVYESLSALRSRRQRCDLYHAALEVTASSQRYTLEMTPAWGTRVRDRGVVLTGPVGVRLLGRSKLFRYEVRCWPDGQIPDLAYAVGDPLVLSSSCDDADRLLRTVQSVPPLTWGRDELDAGDMWNSNSVVAFLLEQTGLPAGEVKPPRNGRAPGWRAGLLAAGQANASTGGHEQTK